MPSSVGMPPSAAAAMRHLLSDRPRFHRRGQDRWDVSVGTLEFIAGHVTAGDRTLEVGCGVSTVIFAAIGADHVAISPARKEHEAITQYCATRDIDTSRIRYLVGRSEDVLPQWEGEVALALIDGAHAFPVPVVDFHYVSRWLPVGGILVIDDVPIPSVGLLYRFLTQEPGWRLMNIIDNRAAAFRRCAVPPRHDNWGDQGINRSYPDYSFLPTRARLGLTAGDWLRHPGWIRALRNRVPIVERSAQWLRRRGF